MIERHAELLVHEHREARAVEAHLRVRAAPDVGNAEIALGERDRLGAEQPAVRGRTVAERGRRRRGASTRRTTRIRQREERLERAPGHPLRGRLHPQVPALRGEHEQGRAEPRDDASSASAELVTCRRARPGARPGASSSRELRSTRRRSTARWAAGAVEARSRIIGGRAQLEEAGRRISRGSKMASCRLCPGRRGATGRGCRERPGGCGRRGRQRHEADARRARRADAEARRSSSAGHRRPATATVSPRTGDGADCPAGRKTLMTLP